MKVFIAVATFLAIASAVRSELLYPRILPIAYQGFSPVALNSAFKTQFHTQDALGQYAYGYSDGLSAKEEIKTLDGLTRGSYSYVDANGKLQTVDYTADALNGFKVAATNLPKALPVKEPQLPDPIDDTREVADAKAAHLAAHLAAKTQSGESFSADQLFDSKDLPKQVEDTPEVAAAKIAHFAAKKDAELANSVIEIIRPKPAIQAAAIPAYSYIPGISNLRQYALPERYLYNYNPIYNGQYFPSPLFLLNKK